MSKPYKDFNNILSQSNTELAQLLDKLRDLESINQSIQKILPQELKAHCKVAKLEQNQLSLAVESSAWASKLRFQSSEILHNLRQHTQYAHIQSIRIVVSPPQTSNSTPSKSWRAQPISTANSQLIAEMANGIQDSALKDALKKLADNSSK